ncbi:MAG: energy transducer TonB [Terriglobales bacterium]
MTKNNWRKRCFVCSALLGAFLILALGQLGAAEVQRQRVSYTAPRYPTILKQHHIGGVVRIEIVITPAGTVKKASVVGGNQVLADFALEAVKKWKYAPAATESTSTVEFRFDPDSH